MSLCNYYGFGLFKYLCGKIIKQQNFNEIKLYKYYFSKMMVFQGKSKAPIIGIIGSFEFRNSQIIIQENYNRMADDQEDSTSWVIHRFTA